MQSNRAVDKYLHSLPGHMGELDFLAPFGVRYD